ncbi:sensor histidine kinase [Paenibacillus cremeus]|nr:histidine kinase [Paenibacillus cremeus]
MLKKLEKMQLKSQLLLLVCVSIGIIMSLQAIYFLWFKHLNTKNYSEFLNDTLVQLEMKAVSFSAEMNNIANLISYNDLTYQFVNSADIEERLRLKNNMQVMIDSIMRSNKNINDIIISDLDMINIGAYRVEDFWVVHEVSQLYKNGAIPTGPVHYVFDGHDRGKPFYVCVTKSFSSTETKTEMVTILIYNVDSFVKTVSSMQTNDNPQQLAIVDAKNNLIAGSRSKDLLPPNPQPFVYQRTVSGLDWRVIGVLPDIEHTQDFTALKQFGTLTGGIVALVLLGFWFVIHKSITSPITKIAQFMNTLGPNYSTRRLTITNHNEISLLARVMNKMLDNIDDMNTEVVASKEKLYKSELAKKNAQFSAFQSQVNPHFLYNTLDCIRSIALSRGVPEIFDITTSMAKIFRYSIKENNYVKIRDELGCIKDYFKIIQIRQGNRFSVMYEVEETIEDCVIPKMILQPIVENAVFHGLEQKKGPGTLYLRGSLSDGCIRFEIEDNGKGISPETLEKLRESLAAWNSSDDSTNDLERKSIGLLNIDRRIKLLYGEPYGIVHVDNGSEGGALVVIQLPNHH